MASNRQARKLPNHRPFNRQVFMSDMMCRERIVARVVSTLWEHFQPRNTAGLAALFTTTIIDAVEAKALQTQRRHHQRGSCESAEISATLQIAWTARGARQLLRAHPRDRTASKTLRTACANLQEIAAGVHTYFETSRKARDSSLMTSEGHTSTCRV